MEEKVEVLSKLGTLSTNFSDFSGFFVLGKFKLENWKLHRGAVKCYKILYQISAHLLQPS